MISLQQFKPGGDRAPLAWWLACLLVAQALFPIQAHTAWETGQDGEVLQICTLNGTQAVLLAPEDEQPHADQSDWRNAACTFSQLLADAVAPAMALPPQWLRLAGIAADSPSLAAWPSSAAYRRAIRAPPATA